jgi:cytoskeletal protein CcmA (bactofilin family)
MITAVMNLLYFIKPGLYVSKQTVIHGNIITDTNQLYSSAIHGDITTHATLVIEKTGVLNGNAHAKKCYCKRKVKGQHSQPWQSRCEKKAEKLKVIVYATEVNVDKQSTLKGTIRKTAGGRQ